MGIKAVKFGGTSLCNAAQMRKAEKIVRADGDRRIIVVSAPGKRSPDDEKITDLLYRCYDETSPAAFEELFRRICRRFDDMIAELSLPLDFSDDYEKMRKLKDYHGGKDYFVSRGEYFSAKLFAALLGYDFIDAAEGIFFREDGVFDALKTKMVLGELLAKHEQAVLPGFYGIMPNDTVKTFARGGSDITGAIAADAAGAYLYENFTDVSGFLLADPKIVDKSKTVDIISYRELRRLSNMGAAVLHEDAVFPVRASGIPINIKNTDHPEAPGTWIVAKKNSTGTVSGIAGKGGFAKILVVRDKIGEDAAMLRMLAGIFERRRIPIYGMPRSVDSVGIVVKNTDTAGKRDYILNEICQCVEPENVSFSEGIALIDIVGDHMDGCIIPAVFHAVYECGEKPLLADLGSDDLGLTVGVRESQLETVIREIYRAIDRD